MTRYSVMVALMCLPIVALTHSYGKGITNNIYLLNLSILISALDGFKKIYIHLLHDNVTIPQNLTTGALKCGGFDK